MIICIVGLTYVHLAAVLLKQYIKKHWSEDEEGFENPVVASNEKVLTESKPLFLNAFKIL